MAVEAVVALMVDKLDKLVGKDAQLLGVNELNQMQHIQAELNQMRRFLKDADNKQKDDEAVRVWMKDIRDICFDVDDVIDILGQGQAGQERHGFVERLKRWISDQITRYKVSKEIERIKLSMNGLSRSGESYGIRKNNEERPEAASSTQRSQVVRRCSVPPEKIEIVIPRVDGQLTNEARTRDIDEGRQEVSSSAPCLQADSQFSTLLGKSEEVGLQEELYTVSQQLIEEEPSPCDGTRDVDVGREEATASSQSLQDRRQFSAVLKESEAVGQQEDFDTLKEQLMDINEGRQEAISSRQSLEEGRRFSALLDEPDIVGEQEEIGTLRDKLTCGELRRCVISIVGMGGSGKTTLAREVYHNVKNDFDCHAFVGISQQYEMKDVLIRVITCVMSKSGAEIGNLPADKLGMMLRDHLKKKSYLVVIDDIWSIKAWDVLKLVLPDSMHRSGVILTTRIKDVAVHADLLYEKRLLNDNEGWELFMRKVFPGESPQVACPSELEETGRKILAKCGGLPLAILDLGGLLARKEKTFREWSNVLKCVPSHLTESSEWSMKILALSYWELPYYLKPCFLYLGLFPEDYEISSDILVSLWIAEGFIKQRGSEIMEDVAQDYLEKLVSRSMLQVVAKKSNGLVDKCCVHVLLHDLCIAEAGQNNFFTIYKDNGTSSFSTSVTRLAFHGNVDGYETSKCSTERLRSMLYFPDSEVLLSKLLNTRPNLLRVLKTDFVDFSKVTLPKGIQVFAHLRYLEIGYSPSHGVRLPLPPSIGDLSNLQTLRVRGGATLPNAIFNLKQLRHLDALWCDIDGHPRLENLRNLYTLYLAAGSWMKDGLDKLTNLRKLKINGDISSYQKRVFDSVEKLHNLQLLELSFAYDSWPTFMPFTLHLDLYEMSLDGSIGKLPELPPYLVKLTLTGSRLQEDAISTLEKLSNLKVLWLGHDSYISKKMICSSGGFPRLESLTLLQLSIEELIVEAGAMPVIKTVDLSGAVIKSVDLSGLSMLSKTTLPSRVESVFLTGEAYHEWNREETGLAGDISIPHAATSALDSNEQWWQ